MTGRRGKPPLSTNTRLSSRLHNFSSLFLPNISTYLWYYPSYIQLWSQQGGLISNGKTLTCTNTRHKRKLQKYGCPYNSSVTPPFQMMNWWPDKGICFQLVTHQRNNNSERKSGGMMNGSDSWITAEQWSERLSEICSGKMWNRKWQKSTHKQKHWQTLGFYPS